MGRWPEWTRPTITYCPSLGSRQRLGIGPLSCEEKDKEKSSIFFRGLQGWRRFAAKSAALEELPKQILRFVHREMKGFELSERLEWVNSEAMKRIRRLKALEKDYEKKMQDEWMQKELEEFERYKRLGRFDNLNL